MIRFVAIPAIAGTATTSDVPMRPAFPLQMYLCRFAITGAPMCLSVGCTKRARLCFRTRVPYSITPCTCPVPAPGHHHNCDARPLLIRKRNPTSIPVPHTPRPQIDTLGSWLRLASVDALTKLLPTAATIAATMLTVEHCHHPLALPALIAAVPLAFHGVLWAAGWTLADAQATGWVMPPTVGAVYSGGRSLPQG